MDNVIRLINDKKQMSNKGALLFLDMSSAYDNVIREKVYKIIENKKMLNENEMKLFKFIHSNIEIKVGGKSCKTSRGAPQGLGTSPLFWNIYLNSLLEELGIKNFKVFAYADDLVIFIQNTCEIDEAIRTCFTWAENHNMKFNEKKSGLIILNNKKFKNLSNIKNIPLVNDYRYLGYEINRKCNLVTFMKWIRKKVFTIIPKIKFATDKLSLHKSLPVIKTLIISNFDYIGPLIMLANQKEVNKIKATIWKATRMIFQLGPNVKNEIVEQLVSPNREKVWGRRILKIKNNWTTKDVNLNTVKEETILTKMNNMGESNKEFNLKDINPKIIDLLNIYNWAPCNEHENKFLNNEHLLEQHNINLDYKIIESLINNKDNTEISRLYVKLKELVEIN